MMEARRCSAGWAYLSARSQAERRTLTAHGYAGLVDLPISSKYRSTPNEPVSEAERSRLSEQLNDAFAAGRIDQTTYSDLLDRVFAAQRLGDLAGVVEVLGKPSTHAVPAIVAADAGGHPGELAEARRPAARSTVALVGAIAGVAVLAVIVLLLLLL